MFAVLGPSAKASEEDQERTRRLADAEMHRHHLESLLDQRDREITALREVISSLLILACITFKAFHHIWFDWYDIDIHQPCFTSDTAGAAPSV